MQYDVVARSTWMMCLSRCFGRRLNWLIISLLSIYPYHGTPLPVVLPLCCVPGVPDMPPGAGDLDRRHGALRHLCRHGDPLAPLGELCALLSAVTGALPFSEGTGLSAFSTPPLLAASFVVLLVGFFAMLDWALGLGPSRSLVQGHSG